MNELITQDQMNVITLVAQTAHRSGLYGGVGGIEKIMMILLAAHDLGIKPTIALNGGIWNIQGKIEISARLMTSMIRRAGHSIKIVKSDEHVCTIHAKRSDNGDTAEVTFTIEEAKKAGLVRQNRDGSAGIWMKYPIDMLYNRCISRLARRLFPDVIGTAYVEGETRDDEIIDITTSIPDEKDLISENQYQTLVGMYGDCFPEYVDKLKDYLKQEGVEDIRYLPRKDYEKIFNGLKKNIALKKIHMIENQSKQESLTCK